MANQQITAQARTVLGKKVKRLRREGLVPGVLYGPAVKGVRPITVTAREFERVYVRAGFSTLLDLVVDGGRAQPVLIHQVQHGMAAYLVGFFRRLGIGGRCSAAQRGNSGRRAGGHGAQQRQG